MAEAACPTCNEASAAPDDKVFPFCSRRCQLVDLGRWLNEDYRIPDPESEHDEFGGGSADPE